MTIGTAKERDWVPAPRSIPAGAVVAVLAVTPTDDAMPVLAATTAGLFRSGDAGRSWEPCGVGFALPTEALAVAPRGAGPATLLAAAAGDLLRSVDGGATWQLILTGSRVLAVAAAIDDDSNAIVLAGTETDGAFRSTDGGGHWTSANPGLLDLTVLALGLSPDFANDKTGFAGTASGLYRTRNGGQAWRALELPVDDPVVQCLAISPAFVRDRTVLAGTEAEGLLGSRDGGRTWAAVPALAGNGVPAIAFGGGDCLAVATEEGVVLSQDAGATWRTTGQGLGPVLSLGFVPDGRCGETLLAGLATGGLARTGDLGAHWQFVSDDAG